jgi:hypothetical protein
MCYKFMEKNIFFNLFIISLCFFLLSSISVNCSPSQEKNRAVPEISDSLSKKTAIRDSMRELWSNYFADYYIPKIDAGVDSFELRVLRYPVIFWPSAHFISFSYTNKQWVLLKTTYLGTQDDDKINNENDSSYSQPVIDSFTTVRIKPLLPIAVILDSLKKFDIVNIPDQDNIPGFNDNIIDGEYYIIEVAVKNNYKIIGYHSPTAFQDKYNKRIVSLLSFIKKYLADFN